MGFALDLGTTSLAGLLVDLQTGKILAKASGGNGQIRYGADVINRIIESDKPGGRRRLQDAVVKESIIPMLVQMYRSANVNPRRIYRMVLAGNTTMNHLLLGLYADPIRMEPFVPSFFQTDYIYVRDIGLKMNPLAELIVAPNIGSYVGGDITAGDLGVHDLEQPGAEPLHRPGHQRGAGLRQQRVPHVLRLLRRPRL